MGPNPGVTFPNPFQRQPEALEEPILSALGRWEYAVPGTILRTKVGNCVRGYFTGKI